LGGDRSKIPAVGKKAEKGEKKKQNPVTSLGLRMGGARNSRGDPWGILAEIATPDLPAKKNRHQEEQRGGGQGTSNRALFFCAKGGSTRGEKGRGSIQLTKAAAGEMRSDFESFFPGLFTDRL